MVALLVFSPTRGLRQGDPLFPSLFIIGSEDISRLLYSSLRGFKIARSCTPLNYLLFVDDQVIFSSATSGEAAIIKTCLDKYSSWSRQTVNIHKSNILFSKNTAPATIFAIQSIIPYNTILLQQNIWDSLFSLVNPKQRLSLTFWKKFKGKLKDGAPKLISGG
jgi:hypothetical protein